jgi:hypothetical protein
MAAEAPVSQSEVSDHIPSHRKLTSPPPKPGNISRQHSAPTPKDLVTPTIKQEVYTTGRGGSGNMAHNDPDRPEIARESQDVESPPLRAQQLPHHTGRGMICLPSYQQSHTKRLDWLGLACVGLACIDTDDSSQAARRMLISPQWRRKNGRERSRSRLMS